MHERSFMPKLPQRGRLSSGTLGGCGSNYETLGSCRSAQKEVGVGHFLKDLSGPITSSAGPQRRELPGEESGEEHLSAFGPALSSSLLSQVPGKPKRR
jgi:hypothetical protein